MKSPSVDFLAGGGEMGERIRSFDWASTPIGSPETWPQSLRLTIRVILNTGHPMFIWWGPDLIQFYNDAYAKTMGPERHPSALGQGGRECWDEIWPIIGPQIDYVLQGKGSTWDEERLVPVTRHGKLEQVWWTYSYGPIDLDDGVGGVLVVCTDVTEQHLVKEQLRDQTRRLQEIFEQAPGFIAVTRGPDHVFELTNASFRKMVGERDLIGKPIRHAFPDLEDQGFFELMDEVFATGEAHVGRRNPIHFRDNPELPTRTLFLDYIYQPIVEANGQVSGVFVEGVDVTEHVRSEEHLSLLNEELKHRVKNTLAMVSAIASQTLSGTDHDAALTAFRERLAVFAEAHDILTRSAAPAVDIRSAIQGALAAHGGHADRISMRGPELVLGSKQTVSLALAIHELATNAIKYGALSNDTGLVDISWAVEPGPEDAFFKLEWRERNGPPVTSPHKKGFGTRLIDRVLRADFNGALDVQFAPEGLVCSLRANMRDINPINTSDTSPFSLEVKPLSGSISSTR